MLENHFDLDNKTAYQNWRAKKLAAYPLKLQLHTIEHDQQGLVIHPNLLESIRQDCQRYNFSLYRFEQPNDHTRQEVHQLAKQLGLQAPHNNLCADNDGLSALTVTQHQGQHDYIPYTNKRLTWHTDGYYHEVSETIHSMLLHCDTPAVEGGENIWLDHEIVYILLRDQDPEWITALTHPNAMTIPANILKGKTIRPARTGTVFSWSQQTQLHMRYSARQRNIEWRKDQATQEAIQFLQNLWDTDSPYHLRYTLKAGEGMVCNNVLHRRTAFTNTETQKRLLYRGRYQQRIT